MHFLFHALNVKTKRTQREKIIGRVNDDDVAEELEVRGGGLREILTTDVDSTQIGRIIHTAVLQLQI